MDQHVRPKRFSKAHHRPKRTKPASKGLETPEQEALTSADPGFEEVAAGLAKYLGWTSAHPSKDANALRGIIASVGGARRLTDRRVAGIKTSLSGEGRRTKPAKGEKMIKDDAKSRSSTAVASERRPTTPSLKVLLRSVLDQPEKWMATPSAQFGGRRPMDLVGTDEEVKIFDVLRAVDQGLF